MFFNGFNPRNDTDSQTGKAGVNYYKVSFIGRILEILGFAKGIDCFEKGQSKVVYTRSKSFLKWRERHLNDEYLTVCEEFSEKMKQKVLAFNDDFEGSIKFIIKSYKTLSIEEVIKRPKKSFRKILIKK
ncbi:MAG: hypothetical protein HWD61_11980 [Parachlamydiaceae bacterium]|nr:MAG: hypothetical protein HWD61_11980 [Parachlamydiaceae bacterium]